MTFDVSNKGECLCVGLNRRRCKVLTILFRSKGSVVIADGRLRYLRVSTTIRSSHLRCGAEKKRVLSAAHRTLYDQ